MANNELSGPIVSMGLINFFRKTKNEKSLRFILSLNNRINSFFESKLFQIKKKCNWRLQFILHR